MWHKSKYVYTVITGPLIKYCMIPSFYSTDKCLWIPSTFSTYNQTPQLPTWCPETKGTITSTMVFPPWPFHSWAQSMGADLVMDKTPRKEESLLLNFVFYCIDSLSLWILEFVGGTSKVTQDVVASVVQEDIFNLKNISPPPIPKYYLVMHMKIWFRVI